MKGMTIFQAILKIISLTFHAIIWIIVNAYLGLKTMFLIYKHLFVAWLYYITKSVFLAQLIGYVVVPFMILLLVHLIRKPILRWADYEDKPESRRARRKRERKVARANKRNGSPVRPDYNKIVGSSVSAAEIERRKEIAKRQEAEIAKMREEMAKAKAEGK